MQPFVGRGGRGGRGGTPGSGGRGGGGDFDEPSNTLFVGNLSFDATKESLMKVFKGSKDVRIATDRETGKPRGLVCLVICKTYLYVLSLSRS